MLRALGAKPGWFLGLRLSWVGDTVKRLQRDLPISPGPGEPPSSTQWVLRPGMRGWRAWESQGRLLLSENDCPRDPWWASWMPSGPCGSDDTRAAAFEWGAGARQGLVLGGSWVAWLQGKTGARTHVSPAGVQGAAALGSGVRPPGMFPTAGGGLAEPEETCSRASMRHPHEEVELFEDCCKVR